MIQYLVIDNLKCVRKHIKVNNKKISGNVFIVDKIEKHHKVLGIIFAGTTLYSITGSYSPFVVIYE